MRVVDQVRRMPRWEVAVLVLAWVGIGSWCAAQVWGSRTGSIHVTTSVTDARVLIDNVEVGRGAAAAERRPGPYTLSVTRDGYARSDQMIEVQLGRATTLHVALEPSPDTGFELTTDPPSGGLVWLDGVPLRWGDHDQQARTDFRASRIAPGTHEVEIRFESRFKPWRQSFIVEAGSIRKIHATLVPLRPDELPRPDIFTVF